jgi:hypothetical protein
VGGVTTSSICRWGYKLLALTCTSKPVGSSLRSVERLTLETRGGCLRVKFKIWSRNIPETPIFAVFRTNPSLGLEGALGASSSQVAPQQIMCTVRSLHQQRSRRSLQKSNLAFFFLSKWAPFPVTNLPPIEHQFAVLRAPRTTEQRTDRDHLFNPINTIPSTNHRQRDRIQQSSTAVPFRSSSTRESLNTEIDANTDPQ